MKFLNILVSIALSSTLIANNIPVNEVMIKTPIGEKFTIDIAPDDSFMNVLETIGSCFENPDTFVLEGSNLKQFTMDIFVADSKISKVVAKQPKNMPRNYWVPVSAAEKEDVAFILKTLSTNSWIKILKQKKALEKAGERVDHLHPFKWLLCIFGNEELNSCVHNIYGKAFVWKEFLLGTTTSLSQEASLGNLKREYIIDFAAKLNIQPDILYPSLNSHQWEKFVDELIKHVPKQNGSDRYSQ